MTSHMNLSSSRRRLLTGAAALGFAAGTGMARAQAYPNRQIRIVVPYGPGGGTDILVRMLAPVVGASLGQTLVMDLFWEPNRSFGLRRMATRYWPLTARFSPIRGCESCPTTRRASSARSP
jgi:hypothetical protein